MKRTISLRATEPGARVRRLSVAQLERVTAGLAYPQPQFDAALPPIELPDPPIR